MKNVLVSARARMAEDTAASVSVEQILFVALAVVVSIYVGNKIYTAVKDKADKTAECIKTAGTLFTGNGDVSGC